MKRWLRSGYCMLLLLFCLAGKGQKKALIEFGWDYPDVTQLQSQLPLMQNSPFDGICFSIHRRLAEAFDTTIRAHDYYEFDKLRKLEWGKYDANFMIIRGYGVIGGAWYDDGAWESIIINMTNLSKALANPGIKGILFDPEYYNPDPLFNPWTYNRKQYPDRSFNELRKQIRKRGTQFIQALQKHKPDLNFLSIWITSLVAAEKLSMDFQDTRHALLISFIEGILEGRLNTVKIIDGNEYAYGYVKPSQFLDAGNFLRNSLAEMMQTAKGKAGAQNISIAQPLFYDGLLATAPPFDKGISTADKWKWLEENTKFALASSDEFTWFYSERLNWWDGSVKDTLTQLLASNKNALNTNMPLHNRSMADQLSVKTRNINHGSGYYYYYRDAKKPMQSGLKAFTYQLNRRDNRLSLHFLEKQPTSLIIYFNTVLFQSISPTAMKMQVKLDGFEKGSVGIIAKYADNSEAAAIEIFK